MAILKFDLENVLKLCKHAKEAKDWNMGYDQTDPKEPALFLVGDHGVYLMSNGQPGLEHKGEPFVVYADGINPKVDKFDTWWDRKIASFGGDDGVDCVPWVFDILKFAGAKPNATKVKIEVSPHSLALLGVE